MEKGKCSTCGVKISSGSYGYCNKCAKDYYDKKEEMFPYYVRFGNDFERFATEKEANDYCDKLRSAFVEKVTP